MGDAQTLLNLQQTDLAILRARKRLENLPEKTVIVNTRAKLNEVCKQRAQVVDMLDEVEQSVNKLQDEDKVLREKSDDISQRLDTTKDYRLISSLTREHEGCVKRREKIGFELTQLAERSSKAEDIYKKVDTAAATLEANEQKAIESYKRNGKAIQEDILKSQAMREELASQLPADLMARYEKLIKTKGGIAVSELQGRMCSVCHVEYQEKQMAEVLAEGEIATCPLCNRLMVVRTD